MLPPGTLVVGNEAVRWIGTLRCDAEELLRGGPGAADVDDAFSLYPDHFLEGFDPESGYGGALSVADSAVLATHCRSPREAVDVSEAEFRYYHPFAHLHPRRHPVPVSDGGHPRKPPLRPFRPACARVGRAPSPPGCQRTRSTAR